MRRREFIAYVGGLAAWPTMAGGQTSGRNPLIGVLMAFDQNDPMVQGWMLALSDELRKLGWTKDHNVRIEYRYAGSDVQAMQRFAKELVELNPNVILSSSTPPTKVLLQHTRTIPIVFGNLVDPVGSGLVASLARPGGNVTGFVNLDPPLALADRDRREELRELRRPAAGHVGARSAATQRSGSLKRDDQARFEATAERRAVSHRRDISLAS